MTLEERLDIAAQVMHRLTEQNIMLNSRILALENVLAHTIASQFPKDRDGADNLANFSTKVSGAAVAISDLMHSWRDRDLPLPVEVPRSMERILSRAESIHHACGNGSRTQRVDQARLGG